MGEVYRAEHRDLQTPVAVKLLNEDISEDHDHVQRFFNEARIVSKIKHAGTVKIFDSGFHKSQAYLIMELLEGESLARRLDRGPLPPAQVLDVSRQIASVLEATHRQGVIHRDLKPDNIYLVHDDERASGERVKILDFGIAKLSGGTMASPKTSGTMGTPAYMAPEQWSDSSQVDWRADAYSLGCVMFEMACGRPPFVAATIPEAYTKHAHTQPPSPRSLNPDVSPDLDALILRLLAKDPADRCVSMGQVTRELEAIANGTDPAAVARDSRPIRAQSPRPDAERPTPNLPAVPPPTMTTLGASAAEIHATRARRPALVGGIVAGIAVLGVVVIVMTRGGAKSAAQEPAGSPEVSPAAATSVQPPPPKPLPPPQPSPQQQPQPSPPPQPQPSPPPQPQAQPSPPPPQPQAQPSPSQPAPAPQPQPQPHTHAATHATPKPPPVVHHTPTPSIDAGAPKPPAGDDLGGRL